MSDKSGHEPLVPSFRMLSAEQVFQGYAFAVEQTKWVDHLGQEFERDVVRHNGAVAIVPITEDLEHVYLVRQFRPTIGDWLLEIPAGLRDIAGENEIDTAHRELMEEVGYSAKTMDYLMTLRTAVGFSDEQISIFLALGLEAGSREADGIEEESMTVECVRLSDIPMMIETKQLVDAKTIAGLSVALHRLNA